MSKMSRKPPLPKSPIRLPPRRVLRSTSTSVQTPLASLAKSQNPIRRTWNMEEFDLRPEYQSISYELRALAKMVESEIGGESGGTSLTASPKSLFERGRFYEEYSARRNERLRRKKQGESSLSIDQVVKTPCHHLGVKIQSGKKKVESSKKSVSAAAAAYNSVEKKTGIPRYSLRSMTKENKKPALPLNNKYERPVISSELKIAGGRRVRKI